MCRKTFHCWDSDNDPCGECGRDVRAWGPEDAAAEYGAARYPDDYPATQTICVRCADGTVRKFSVGAVPTVRFVTREVG